MVLTSTHNLCFEQNYVKYQEFLSENFHFSVIKFSVYLNRHVFIMGWSFSVFKFQDKYGKELNIALGRRG